MEIFQINPTWIFWLRPPPYCLNFCQILLKFLPDCKWSRVEWYIYFSMTHLDSFVKGDSLHKLLVVIFISVIIPWSQLFDFQKLSKTSSSPKIFFRFTLFYWLGQLLASALFDSLIAFGRRRGGKPSPLRSRELLD